eukprot:jgi/Chlat1/4426/Chrsp29S04392
MVPEPGVVAGMGLLGEQQQEAAASPSPSQQKPPPPPQDAAGKKLSSDGLRREALRKSTSERLFISQQPVDEERPRTAMTPVGHDGPDVSSLEQRPQSAAPLLTAMRRSPLPSSALASTRVDRLLRERAARISEEIGRAVRDKTTELVRPPSAHGRKTTEADESAPVRQRLLVVANRLPITATRNVDGSWRLVLSAGGLVSALLGVKQNFETVWIGWPGAEVPEEADRANLSAALQEKGCVPVYLTEQIMALYYNGYCNNVLWPLFHYMGLPVEDNLGGTRNLQTQWMTYKRANEQFSRVVASIYQPGDVVWCHDYHLLLLPSYLKALNPEMKVGWFLHTPFPSSEIYRTLPARDEILRGVLSADLIGFHTYDYARHFVSACSRILGLEGTPEGVEHDGVITRVAAFPIGIDPQRFLEGVHLPEVQKHILELKQRFAGRKVMLGVDRLDTIKGIPQKLLAFEKFLEDNKEWRDKVVLVQIAVPSRTDVPEWCTDIDDSLHPFTAMDAWTGAATDQRLTKQVHEIVGRINGRFGTIGSVPIHHLDRSLQFNELCALYALTDVALVTSVRDGMNLVSYEYVACQEDRKGVLILSEFAGAAQSLGAGALLVNPWNIGDMANAMEDALNMSEGERRERHRHNFLHVTTHTAQAWADTFVSELNDTVVEAKLRRLRVPPRLKTSDVLTPFRTAQNRLIVVGFTNTLTVSARAQRRHQFDQVKAAHMRVHPTAYASIKALAEDESNTVLIISGCKRSRLEEDFGNLPVWLAAEHGLFFRNLKGEWSSTASVGINLEWLDSVQLVFDYFCERTPRSYVQARETSLVWNYKYADVEFGRLQARDMLQHLWTGPISNAAVDVVQGYRSVEVRPVGVSKGAAIGKLLSTIIAEKHFPPRADQLPFDFVLCMGHFLTKDEDIFSYFDGDATRRRSSIDPDSAPSSPVMLRSRRHSMNSLTAAAAEHATSAGSPISAMSPPSLFSLGSHMACAEPDMYFSCTVARKRSRAKYSLQSPEEVANFLATLADPSASSALFQSELMDMRADLSYSSLEGDKDAVHQLERDMAQPNHSWNFS